MLCMQTREEVNVFLSAISADRASSNYVSPPIPRICQNVISCRNIYFIHGILIIVILKISHAEVSE